MNTPIFDFVKEYANKNVSRFHMPGHKGHSFLGCEAYDITEVAGADALYEADGIIAESEQNATELFGTARTLFSTEGSSQCIRAMLYLAVNHWKNQSSAYPNHKITEDSPIDNYSLNEASSSRPYIIAARNVHKAFLYAAALIDFDIVWLYPEEMHSLCSCHIFPEQLEAELKKHSKPPAAVYVTSPDYLGGQLSIEELAKVCHQYGTILAVDNAHGSYLHFLENPLHPIDLGADICCDSAHKTLPVLTGGAYLQISKNAPASFCSNAKQAMALFGSTSPSYLTLASLDLCNSYLADGYKEKLAKTIGHIEKVRHTLCGNGWNVEKTEPLKITVKAPEGLTEFDMADRIRLYNIECEYADAEYIVFMASPENTEEDYNKLISSFERTIDYLQNFLTSVDQWHFFDKPDTSKHIDKALLKPAKCIQKLSVREAIFANHELIPVKEALGRICGTPTVGCPPAIPIVVSGELIDENAVALFEYYGITTVDVVK